MKLGRDFSFLLAVFLCSSLGQAQSNAKLLNVTFTTIDVPGAIYTGVFGVNSAGIMVGNYGQNTISDSHGFIYSNGVFTYFDYPGETITVPTGINDSDLIVGYAGSFTITGFLYDGTDYTSITDGNNSATYADGINNSGVVVGGAGTIYNTKGFEMRNGRFRTLNVAGGYTYIYGNGINNLGTIVGWTESDGFICHGSTCKIMDYPGSSQTEARGINDAGVIVGWYAASGCICGFASKNGRFISFAFPGAAATTAAGINKAGQIVGQYTFDYNAWHGFVTNPITDADFQ